MDNCNNILQLKCQESCIICVALLGYSSDTTVKKEKVIWIGIGRIVHHAYVMMVWKILIMLFTWEMVDLLGFLDLLECWWFHMLSPGGTGDKCFELANMQKSLNEHKNNFVWNRLYCFYNTMFNIVNNCIWCTYDIQYRNTEIFNQLTPNRSRFFSSVGIQSY